MDDWRRGADADAPRAFPCLHRTRQGRIFHCPEFRRVVIDFQGAYLVLRRGEFLRLREHFRRLAGCGLSRSRLLGGERIRLRDALGEGALLLSLPELQELVELMEIAVSRLNEPIPEGVWQDA